MYKKTYKEIVSDSKLLRDALEQNEIERKRLNDILQLFVAAAFDRYERVAAERDRLKAELAARKAQP